MQCSNCNKELSPFDDFCPQCGKSTKNTHAAAAKEPAIAVAAAPIVIDTNPPVVDSPVRVAPANKDPDNMLLADINRRLTALERKIPETKILSHSFWTRSWAVFGHAIVPAIIINIVFFVILLILSLLFAHFFMPNYILNKF